MVILKLGIEVMVGPIKYNSHKAWLGWARIELEIFSISSSCFTDHPFHTIV